MVQLLMTIHGMPVVLGQIRCTRIAFILSYSSFDFHAHSLKGQNPYKVSDTVVAIDSVIEFGVHRDYGYVWCTEEL